MNVAELRIGNWIMVDDIPAVVYAIHQNEGIRATIGGLPKSYESVVRFDHDFRFEPIPLTDYWLQRFGFERDKDDVYVINNVMFWLDDGRLQIADGYTPLINAPCKYIHQLQNLYFALTGEELDKKS